MQKKLFRIRRYQDSHFPVRYPKYRIKVWVHLRWLFGWLWISVSTFWHSWPSIRAWKRKVFSICDFCAASTRNVGYVDGKLLRTAIRWAQIWNLMISFRFHKKSQTWYIFDRNTIRISGHPHLNSNTVLVYQFLLWKMQTWNNKPFLYEFLDQSGLNHLKITFIFEVDPFSGTQAPLLQYWTTESPERCHLNGNSIWSATSL